MVPIGWFLCLEGALFLNFFFFWNKILKVLWLLHT